MSTFGRSVLGTVGGSIEVTADGNPEMKVGGITVDWTTVAAYAGADFTINDGITITNGDKYLRYGQVVAKITASGLYGPYDPAAADGRQLLNRGAIFIVNTTMKMNDLHSDHPAVLDGGRVYRDRLIATAGAHTLAAGPTYTELEEAFPRLSYVLESPQ